MRDILPRIRWRECRGASAIEVSTHKSTDACPSFRDLVREVKLIAGKQQIAHPTSEARLSREDRLNIAAIARHSSDKVGSASRPINVRIAQERRGCNEF